MSQEPNKPVFSVRPIMAQVSLRSVCEPAEMRAVHSSSDGPRADLATPHRLVAAAGAPAVAPPPSAALAGRPAGRPESPPPPPLPIATARPLQLDPASRNSRRRLGLHEPPPHPPRAAPPPPPPPPVPWMASSSCRGQLVFSVDPIREYAMRSSAH